MLLLVVRNISYVQQEILADIQQLEEHCETSYSKYVKQNKTNEEKRCKTKQNQTKPNQTKPNQTK
jgi:hypothetical protein